jgi:hypothetical protein
MVEALGIDRTDRRDPLLGCDGFLGPKPQDHQFKEPGCIRHHRSAEHEQKKDAKA